MEDLKQRNCRFGDAFGHALLNCFREREGKYKEGCYIIERDDGYVDVGSLRTYFTEYGEWPEIERHMPDFVRGRVLDIGCGAGRHSLHLQNMGLDVVAIDKSRLAIEVARQRGVKKALPISIEEMELISGFGEEAPFNSVIMMGHNLGLLHGFEEARNLLSRLHLITSADARIIGTTRDPRDTNDSDHMEYQEWNRRRGRMPGQISFRIRYRRRIDSWRDYLFVSEGELCEILNGTGWFLWKTMKGEGGFGGSSYLAVLCKTGKV